MQIVITGPRAGGSTTLAIEIGKMLRSKGIDVRFKSRNCDEEMIRIEAMNQPSPDVWQPSTVVIVDGLEPEDEQTASQRNGPPSIAIRSTPIT